MPSPFPSRTAGVPSLGQLTLAVAPGDFLDDDGAAAPAIDAPHGVQEEDKESPQGDELEAPLPEPVVTGGRPMAARTDCGRTLARPHGDFDALLVRTEAGVLINKAPKMVAAV